MNNLAYIETFGCQMNERDSEIMGQLLAESDCSITDDIDKAHIVVVNTCSIREKAENKAYTLMGRLGIAKQKRPSLIIAVTGCVAQQEGRKIQNRMPFVDLVVGPQNIYRLPDLIRDIEQGGLPCCATELAADFEIPPFLPSLACGAPYKKFVTIMQGCNNFCAYCVVPYTRGREASREPRHIIDEIKNLAACGVKEITLLGQNVNSFGLDKPAPGRTTFPELLHQVSAITGVERIRFTTSHPKDLSEDLMQCFAELDNLCPHFHLPVQSGSNAVLKKMNRKYTTETYLEKVAKLRDYCPEIAISTDIIVGFPGETAEDFEETMELLDKVRYVSAFSFKYSDRPNTQSAAFTGKVSEKEKSARLSRLQQRQKEITMEKNREFVDRIIPIMIEGESRIKGQLYGRTPTNHIVNFECDEKPEPGRIVQVKIKRACRNSLQGEL